MEHYGTFFFFFTNHMSEKTTTFNGWNEATISIVKRSALISAGIVGYLGIRKLYDKLSRKYHEYPDGPCGYPLIGSLIESLKDSRKFLSQLEKEYGDVAMFYQGQTPVVVINNSDIMNEYFNKKEFSNRPETSFFKPKSLALMNLNEMHFRRKMLVQSMISKTQRTTNLNHFIGKVLINNTFKIINDCIENNQTWTIRNEIKYVTFLTIFGMFLNVFLFCLSISMCTC